MIRYMLYWGDRRESVLAEIQSIIHRGRWDDLGPIVDHSFFALSITDPAVMHNLWQHVPEPWLDAHPRYMMSAAIARSGSIGYRSIHEIAQARFERWVDQTPQPATRDLLGVITTRIQRALAGGQFAQAVSLAEEAERLIHNATETSGFDDLLSSVLILNGLAYLFAGRVPRALENFSESWRWATHVSPHPIAGIAAEHRALSLVLMHEFAEAQYWLDQSVKANVQNSVDPAHRPIARMLAASLLAIEHLDTPATDRVLSSLDDRVSETGLWWVEVHARARAALYRGVPGPAIALLERELSARARLSGPDSMAGLLLRGDLADLYQLAGNLTAARRILSGTGLPEPHQLLATSRMRLLLLEDNPQGALNLLATETSQASEAGVTVYTRWSVLRACALGILGAPETEDALREAAESIRYRHAPNAPFEVDSATRAGLYRLLDSTPPTKSFPSFPYGRSSRLTARERQVLEHLASAAPLPEIAAQLHVSKNTLKSHLRSLYRKLGVSTREEAVRAGRHRDGGEASNRELTLPR